MSEKEPQLSDVRNQIVDILELPVEEYDQAVAELINKRHDELVSKSIPKRIHGIGGNYQGFFHPDSEIAPAYSGTGFKVDDSEVYAPFAKHLRYFYELFFKQFDGDKAKAYRNAVIYAAQYAQQDYFGNIHPGKEAARAREDLIWRGAFVTDEPEDEQVASVSQFKNIAMCAERAAVANNLMHIAGFNPVYVMGELKLGDKRSELHAYLVMQNSEGTNVIYDPTNPHLLLNEEGGIASSYPGIYKVDEDFLKNTKAHAEGTYRVMKRENGQTTVQEEVQYVYENNPFHSDYLPAA